MPFVSGVLGSLLDAKIKQSMNEANQRAEASRKLTQFITNLALYTGQDQVFEDFGDVMKKTYGKETYEQLKRFAAVQPGLRAMAEMGDGTLNDMREISGLAPQPAPTGQAQPAPAAPAWKPPPKTLSRVDLTPTGQLDFNTINNPQYDPEMDAGWVQQYLTLTAQGIPATTAILQLAKPAAQGGMGWIPSEILSKLDDITDKEKEQAFVVMTHALQNNAEFIKAVQQQSGLSGEALQEEVFERALTASALKSGSHPSWAEPIITGQTDVQYIRDMREKRETQIQEEMVRRGLERTKPIPPEKMAEVGITPGAFTSKAHGNLPTYVDLVNSGFRFMSPKDRQLYESVSATLNVVDNLAEMALELFTSKDDYASRLAHGATLTKEKMLGTSLGIVAKDYSDAIESIPRLLLPLVGEQGGRFTDKDMEQIQKLVPLTGFAPDGKGVARRKLDRLKNLLREKLELIHQPQLIQIQDKKKATYKVIDGKLVPIKR